MSFSDLIEKYKSGVATEEERQMIEIEIEKNEAINEYLSEQIIVAIPEIGKSMPTHGNIAEATKIRKRINRKFAGMVLASVSAVIAIFCVIQFIVFPFINSRYYDPTAGRGYFAGVGGLGQMTVDMSVFSTLHMMGYEIPFVFARPEGLGIYDITMYQYDAFRNYSESMYRSRLVRGALDIAMLDEAFSRGLRLNWVQVASVYGSETPDALTELTRLPESARVKAFLVFDEAVDMQSLIEFINANEPLRVLWAGIKTFDDESFANPGAPFFGFPPMGRHVPLADNVFNAELFPALGLSRGIEHDSGVFETHFVSTLSYMSTRGEFMEVIGFSIDYANAVAYVMENGVKSHGVVVSGSRDEIMELLSNPMIQSVFLDDVIVSVFSRD